MTAIIATWEDRDGITGSVTPDGIRFETPVAEQVGIEDRRVAWIHPFSEVDLAWIATEFPDVEIREGLPEDWRYPDEEPE